MSSIVIAFATLLPSVYWRPPYRTRYRTIPLAAP